MSFRNCKPPCHAWEAWCRAMVDRNHMAVIDSTSNLVPPLTSPAASNVEFVSIDSGGVLLDLDSGQVLSLNESAADIWRLHLEGRSRNEIASDFMRRYLLDEDSARADVDRALTIPAYSAKNHGDNL